MKLSFLIPFRDADGTRTRAKDWIVARWRHFYPEAEFILEPDDGVDPFCKSMAVNRAAAKATGDVYVILDADSWIEPQWMDLAFEKFAHRVPWVIPIRRSYRLTQQGTEPFLSSDPTGPLPKLVNRRIIVEQSGPVAGFCHIVPRQGFEAVGGMDERFRGWGGEDTCFTRALDVVWGRHMQLPGTVVSMWHARPRGVGGRTWEGQTADHYAIRQELGRRYGAVGRSKAAMLALLATEGGPLHGGAQVESKQGQAA